MKLQTYLVLSVNLALAMCQLSDEMCKVLALKGGGTKGAYEVGVLKGFVQHLKPDEYDYDVVVGVSAGALNAASIARFPKGQEKEAIEDLEDFWMNNMCQDSWSFWDSYILGGFYKDSFLDDSKMITKAHQRFDNMKFQRDVSFQAVDLNTGSVVIFDETLSDEYRALAVKASASIPGFFKPVEMFGMKLVDGGTFDSLDLTEGIVKCKNKGFDYDKIIVDIILCYDKPKTLDRWKMQEGLLKSTLDYYFRNKELNSYYAFIEDFTKVIKNFPKVNFRYVIQPSEKLPSFIVPIYSHVEDIKYQIEIGQSDAETLIRSNNYSNIDDLQRLLLHQNISVNKQM